ncbi:MAG: FAD-dependent oxidoreductase [Myxococcota bacterium]
MASSRAAPMVNHGLTNARMPLQDAKHLIVGAGLSGLALAARMSVAGADYQLVESRDRIGGRILSEPLGDPSGAAIDLGPSWIWPGQPRVLALARRFSLRLFEQYAQGDGLFEDGQGVQRGRGFASMAGSYRIEGGVDHLVRALRGELNDRHVHLSQRLNTLRLADGVLARFEGGEEHRFERVVLCLPPRVAAERITFDPALGPSALQAMRAIPTWMAGHAKAVAVYERAFWREAGLAGDAMSRRGPLAEIHDASPAEGGPGALFGFFGLPPDERDAAEDLEGDVLRQLGRLFGPGAASPLALRIQDWAREIDTAVELDHARTYGHPEYGLPSALVDLWDGALTLASTETAPAFGGYLEGALEAAERAAATLLR